MLSIFLFFGIATMFSRKAFDKNRNRYLWGTIGVLSYFIMPFIVGIVIAVVSPESLDNERFLNILGIVAGFLGVGVAYFILHKLSDPTENLVADNDLLDSQL